MPDRLQLALIGWSLEPIWTAFIHLYNCLTSSHHASIPKQRHECAWTFLYIAHLCRQLWGWILDKISIRQDREKGPRYLFPKTVWQTLQWESLPSVAFSGISLHQTAVRNSDLESNRKWEIWCWILSTIFGPDLSMLAFFRFKSIVLVEIGAGAHFAAAIITSEDRCVMSCSESLVYSNVSSRKLFFLL